MFFIKAISSLNTHRPRLWRYIWTSISHHKKIRIRVKNRNIPYHCTPRKQKFNVSLQSMWNTRWRCSLKNTAAINNSLLNASAGFEQCYYSSKRLQNFHNTEWRQLQPGHRCFQKGNWTWRSESLRKQDTRSDFIITACKNLWSSWASIENSFKSRRGQF